MAKQNMKNLFYRFEARIVRAVVPANTIGVYVLARYEGGKLVVGYVGRSDISLQHRLASHNLLDEFDYFWFRTEGNVQNAFLSEARFWHELKDEVVLSNKVHPAIPEGSNLVCPYCVSLTQIRHFLQATRSA